MEYPRAITTPPHASAAALKLSDEPGFVTIDISGPATVKIPVRTGGLLAFLHVDQQNETVIKMLMLDNLSKGFIENRPFSGRANRIAFLMFPEISNFEQRVAELANRLQLYAELTAKYQGRKLR